MDLYSSHQPGFEWDLDSREFVWRDHYYFLQQRGYQLRPRYKPGWQGSWLTNGKDIMECEDRLAISDKNVLDALRISDGVKVALKLVETCIEELPIARYLSLAPLRFNPRNHCVPILDVVPMPANDDWALIVMPFLRHFNNPPFNRKVECIEALYQMLEGLEFMHEHNIAHRDACFFNFTMDATKIIPRGFHHCERYTYDGVHCISRYKTRKSVGPIKYYWIDFDLSIRFPSFEQRRLVYGDVGQERNIPEMCQDAPYDAFKADIFQVGMTIKRFCEDYEGLEFMQPFIDSLLQTDPEQRPSASEALLEFIQIVQRLKHRKLNGFVTEKLRLEFTNKYSEYPEHRSRLRRKRISAWKRHKLAWFSNIIHHTSNTWKNLS